MSKKVLFIDRDGTLIIEPPDEQVDSFDKLEFYPKVFRNLYLIQQNFDYELVIVTNQDGLGTNSFPEKDFRPVHDFMLNAFKNEGIIFDDVIIDITLPEDNSPTRKPGTALLEKYIQGDYDLENSFVIGDRLTDIRLAKNLKSKGILIAEKDMVKEVEANNLAGSCSLISNDWDEIFEFLRFGSRYANISRSTKETEISVKLNLDGKGKCNISTGLGFFDHMLEQIGKHSECDLDIEVKGDLNVDEHHTIEDTAIVLGEAIKIAMGDKRGMERYGFVLPMDDSLAQVSVDFGGRSWLVWNATFKREKIGEMPTEMFSHFFKSFTDSAKCNLNIKAEGENEHHKIESIFKAFAKTIKMAKNRNSLNTELPSTKGVI